MTGTILERIVETKRREVAEAKLARPAAELWAAAERITSPRDFYGAIVGGPPVKLIAEIKKASPSAGVIRPDFDPAAIARIYEGGGAAALSVLTDRTYFAGDIAFIAAVKDAVDLPVLRKDFITDEYQILESRAAGADAVLLIAAILSPGQIDRAVDLADQLGLATLVEVHDRRELHAAGPLVGRRRRAILGINNRDLRSQAIDLDTTRRLASELPTGTPFVSESGIGTRSDVLSLQEAGASAVLIGETFMRAADIGAKVRELTGHDY